MEVVPDPWRGFFLNLRERKIEQEQSLHKTERVEERENGPQTIK